MTYLIAFLAGAFVILSLIINSELGTYIGIFESTFINYLVGFILSVALLILIKPTTIINFAEIPIFAYLGGIIGVIAVIFTNMIVPKIPAIYSTILLFGGQLLGGITIDYFFNNIFSPGKIIGSFIIIIGIVITIFSDKKEKKKTIRKNAA